MSLHRIARYEQLSRDLGTGAALEQQRQNLLLAPRQIERPRRMRAPRLDRALLRAVAIDEPPQILNAPPLQLISLSPRFPQKRAYRCRASAQKAAKTADATFPYASVNARHPTTAPANTTTQ